MQIEQIVELQLRGLGPPGLTCTAITGYFHDKTKIPKENLRVGFHFSAKMLHETMHLTSSHLDQITYNWTLTPKCEMLNVFWT